MHLDGGPVERERLDHDPHHLLRLQLLEHLIENAVLGPSASSACRSCASGQNVSADHAICSLARRHAAPRSALAGARTHIPALHRQFLGESCNSLLCAFRVFTPCSLLSFNLDKLASLATDQNSHTAGIFPILSTQCKNADHSSERRWLPLGSTFDICSPCGWDRLFRRFRVSRLCARKR